MSNSALPLRAPTELPETNTGRRWLTLTTPGWLVSLITHVAILIMLGVCYFDLDSELFKNFITAIPNESVEELELLQPPIENLAAMDDSPLGSSILTPVGHLPTSASLMEEIASSIQIDTPDLAIVDELHNQDPVVVIDYLDRPNLHRDNFLSNRRARRSQLVKASTGMHICEATVDAGLKWLVQHQRADGSWDFDHRQGPCKTNAGTLADARNGATGIALLALLGAGETHTEGNYKQSVRAGLGYLVRNMKIEQGKLGNLSDTGNMYSHGIATIALSEAYAMTNDKELQAPAQAAIDYIVYAQDPVGGGWRYAPKQAGDTSVLGWQLMALKSGHMAYLNVPPATVKGAMQFLDSVQADSGAAYGYTSTGDGQGTTSVGLLCRMYLGWKADNGAIERGVARLSELGPSKSNLYYNYYATQVLHHYGLSSALRREKWTKWNDVLRDQLVNSQAKDGAERGSWYTPGDLGSERGGRVYCTAMSIMILEVYYRHPPIYGAQAADDDFPL